MGNKKKAIAFCLLVGVVIIFIIFFLIKKNYLFSGSLAVVLVLGLSFAGRLSAPLYFERTILNLLKTKNGQIKRERIIEYFKKSAPSIEEADIESTVASTLRKLEKKGTVSTDNERDIIILLE